MLTTAGGTVQKIVRNVFMSIWHHFPTSAHWAPNLKSEMPLPKFYFWPELLSKESNLFMHVSKFIFYYSQNIPTQHHHYLPIAQPNFPILRSLSLPPIPTPYIHVRTNQNHTPGNFTSHTLTTASAPALTIFPSPFPTSVPAAIHSTDRTPPGCACRTATLCSGFAVLQT